MSFPPELSSSTTSSVVNGDLQVCIDEYRDILEEYLELCFFRLPPYQADEEFYQEVIRGCASVQNPQRRESLARNGAAAAKRLYPSHDRATQISIAIFTALMFSVDDLGGEFPEALRSYRKKLMLRQPQDNKQVADFLDSALHMEDWLDSFAVDMVFKAQLEFLSANLVENEYGDQLCPHKSTPHFLRNYFRLKSAICEPYALFIWPSEIMKQARTHCRTPVAVMPDVMTWIADTNDIMSFYKESIIGNEQNNVVNLDARANEKTPTESIKDYVESATKALIRIREFAESQHPEVRKKLEEFIHGYIAFHYEHPRYRLKELNISVPKLD